MEPRTPWRLCVLSRSLLFLLPVLAFGGCRRSETLPHGSPVDADRAGVALTEEPPSVRREARRARQLLEEGQAREAIGVLRQMLEGNPTFADGWNDLGTAQIMAGDTAGARRSWQRAVALDPALISARCNLAQLVLRDAKIEQALTSYEEIVGEAPGYPAAWAGLGEAALKSGAITQARRAFEEATRLQPDSVPAWIGLSEALYQAKLYGPSREAAARARKIQPDSERARLLLALARVDDETGEEALHEAAGDLRALFHRPEYRSTAAYGLGRYFQRQGKPYDAVLYLRVAVEGDGSHMPARYQLARALLRSGKRKEGTQAMATYDRLFKATEELASLRLRARGRPKDAELQIRLKHAEANQSALLAESPQ